LKIKHLYSYTFGYRTKILNVMKNFKMLMLAVAGCLSLTACSNDDDNNGVNNNTNADLTGTYRMTSWNAPMAVDLNGDGTTNTNVMTETNCYNNSMMTINQNGTYTMTYNSAGINGTAIECDTETTVGTWTRSGNTFTTTQTGGASLPINYSFQGGSNTTLTRNMTGWQYPTMNGGVASWSTGNVNMVMTRDND
jgi:hypothetical protein